MNINLTLALITARRREFQVVLNHVQTTDRDVINKSQEAGKESKNIASNRNVLDIIYSRTVRMVNYNALMFGSSNIYLRAIKDFYIYVNNKPHSLANYKHFHSCENRYKIFAFRFHLLTPSDFM